MGTIKLIIAVSLIGAVIVVGMFVIPPYFANYQFEDDIKNEAMTLTYTAKTEDEIRQIVLKHASDEGIDITPQQIMVQRTGTQGAGSLLIEANYTVHVNLPGYPFDLPLHAGTKNKGIY
jgi:DNA-binding transcriptional MocR family regulator